MAYVNSRSASVSLSDRIGSAVRMVKDSVARRQLYNRTLTELNGLTDRDLADLGISRANISDLAREASSTK
jgi:uncharacterized protein YjiS (DUF1127 family)